MPEEAHHDDRFVHKGQILLRLQFPRNHSVVHGGFPSLLDATEVVGASRGCCQSRSGAVASLSLFLTAHRPQVTLKRVGMSCQPLRQLVRQARPRPAAVVAPILPRFQSSAACAPLAHPSGAGGRFAPTSETKSYGQPLPSTHPHLLQPGELTPFVSADEYHQRRQRLVDSLEDGAIVVIAGGQIQYMTQNIL